MLTVRKQAAAVFVDRACGRWVVRDADGFFWLLPHSDDPWRDRQPHDPAEGADLEPVPGHYRPMLGLPF